MAGSCSTDYLSVSTSFRPQVRSEQAQRAVPVLLKRMVPPLIIEDSHVDEAIAIIDKAAGELDA